MATLNLSVTVPDAQVSRMQAAARLHFGQVSDGAGGMRDMTNAEIVEALRQTVITTIKAIVKTQERLAAQRAADQLDPAIDPS